jgi:hypothetical protein
VKHGANAPHSRVDFSGRLFAGVNQLCRFDTNLVKLGIQFLLIALNDLNAVFCTASSNLPKAASNRAKAASSLLISVIKTFCCTAVYCSDFPFSTTLCQSKVIFRARKHP